MTGALRSRRNQIEVTEHGTSRTWAADIALASKKFDRQIPAAMKDLEEVAAKVNRAVMVGCKPFVRSERHTRNQWNALMREYQDNIHDRVVIAAMRPSATGTTPRSAPTMGGGFVRPVSCRSDSGR